MTRGTLPWSTLAAWLDYPPDDGLDLHEESLEAVIAAWPAAAEPARRFAAWARGKAASEQQEFFIRTFDSRQETALELGWHLFGESYHRGSFLVSMRSLLRTLGIEEGIELPDHVSLVLRCLERMEPDQAADLSAQVEPALRKIAVALAAGENPYEHAVDAALAALHQLAPQTLEAIAR